MLVEVAPGCSIVSIMSEYGIGSTIVHLFLVDEWLCHSWFFSGLAITTPMDTGWSIECVKLV